MAKENKNTTATVQTPSSLINPEQKSIADLEFQLQHATTSSSHTPPEFIALPESPSLPMEDTKPTPAHSVASEEHSSIFYDASPIRAPKHGEVHFPNLSTRLFIYTAINLAFFCLFLRSMLHHMEEGYYVGDYVWAALSVHASMTFLFGLLEVLLYLLAFDVSACVHTIKQAGNLTGLRGALGNWLRHWANKVYGGRSQKDGLETRHVAVKDIVDNEDDLIEDEDAPADG